MRTSDLMMSNNRVYSEIGERVRMVEDWLKSHVELEALIKERTAELQKANEELRKEIAVRKRTENELRVSEQKLNSIIKLSPDIIYRLDENGIITFISHAVREYGYAPDELIGTRLLDLVVPQCRGKAFHRLNERRTGFRSTRCFEIQLLSKKKIRKYSSCEAEASQEYPYFLISAQGLYQEDEGGIKRFIGTQGTARDITQRRWLEQEILEISHREQRRFGQDLHDGLCQHLKSVEYLLAVMRKNLEGKSLPEAKEASKIAGLVNQAVSQAYALAKGLCPVDLDEGGLMTALQQLTANISKYYSISCSLEFDCPALLADNSVAIHLYRIAQEAVFNAVNHGHPQKILIGISKIGDRIVLLIRDDGKGIPSEEILASHKGMGLDIMRHRARAIGGDFDIRQEPEGGTSVVCAFPASNGSRWWKP
ncbi:MAG: ATP-binding protein [Candidatus Omnitrophota bacterium]